MINASDRVAVVIPDITRPLPNDRLLPWLFAELAHVPTENFVIINGTGSHRVNTPEELAGMVGAAVFGKYKIVNHNSHDPETLKFAGKTPDGRSVYYNREYVEADKRIVLGFIEPHFMAGFSGGYKGIFPAVADIDAIMHYHRAEVIGSPRSTWGVLEGNPTQEQIRANGSLLPVDFCLNVTLNRKREITNFFCGEVLAAHEQGCAFPNPPS
ncbi:MAG: lactate racemase domain-containing protein [Acidobacteriota bacterium]